MSGPPRGRARQSKRLESLDPKADLSYIISRRRAMLARASASGTHLGLVLPAPTPGAGSIHLSCMLCVVCGQHRGPLDPLLAPLTHFNTQEDLTAKLEGLFHLIDVDDNGWITLVHKLNSVAARPSVSRILVAASCSYCKTQRANCQLSRLACACAHHLATMFSISDSPPLSPPLQHEMQKFMDNTGIALSDEDWTDIFSYKFTGEDTQMDLEVCGPSSSRHGSVVAQSSLVECPFSSAIANQTTNVFKRTGLCAGVHQLHARSAEALCAAAHRIRYARG